MLQTEVQSETHLGGERVLGKRGKRNGEGERKGMRGERDRERGGNGRKDLVANLVVR